MNTIELWDTEHHGIRLARAALTRLMEPSDLAGAALIKVLGPVEGMAFIGSRATSNPGLEKAMTEVLQDAGTGRWPGLSDALSRWHPRLGDLAAERDLDVIRRLGGGLLIPEAPGWPVGLADLQLNEPIALWLRGQNALLPAKERCIAVVGSRDSTSYGDNVASEMASALVQRGYTVVSGGAYGIDAQAHRGALSVGWGSITPVSGGVAGHGAPATLAVMAGGLDRFYPSGNEGLLRAIAEQGALIAEVPPGGNPTRYRFLQRNRLIAALCQVSVVVEARWRSGALNTAHHADSLSRSVGAVPGSVYSANSAGCHRLLREGVAVCVVDAADVAELAGAPGSNLATEPEGQAALYDGLSSADLMILDALPLRSRTTLTKLCTVAGLGTAQVLAGLGRLEALGLAQRLEGDWKRAP